MLRTNRLILRQWQTSDFASYAEMNADPKVMRYFPNTLTEARSDEQALRIQTLIKDRGYGFWALESLASGDFLGFVGLNYCDAESGIPNAPLIEIGWRLAYQHWGKGYATEAAKRALQFAFDDLREPAVYAFTSLLNTPSQQVMTRIGMSNTGQDFDHPQVPDGHELKRHCLFKISRETWQTTHQLRE